MAGGDFLVVLVAIGRTMVPFPAIIREQVRGGGGGGWHGWSDTTLISEQLELLLELLLIVLEVVTEDTEEEFRFELCLK